eukprot:s2435_g2.t1
MEGDDTLWNYLGEQRCIVSLLRKINGAWHPTETERTLEAAPKYSLACFSVPSAVPEWVSTTHKSKALILSGRGEVSKTSLAAAALASVCGHYHFISSRDQIKGLIFLNSEGLLWDEACFAELDVDLCKGLVYHFISSRDQIKGLIFLNSEGLLWDEACFAELDVDLCKGLVDLEHDRSIHCRNVDGLIPAGCASADVVTSAVPTISDIVARVYSLLGEDGENSPGVGSRSVVDGAAKEIFGRDHLLHQSGPSSRNTAA